METTQVSKSTQLIEQTEQQLKALVDRYNETIQQLQHYQQLAAQLRDEVLTTKARYDALVEMNKLHIDGE